MGRSPDSAASRAGFAVAVAISQAVFAAMPAAQQLGPSDVPAGVHVECPADDEGVCRTDVATYVGWRVFGEYCAGCHSGDALGSEFAPSLVQRIRRYDRQGFYRVLDNGYVGRDSELGPWGQNADVARYYPELWSYLSARASGVLPPAALRPVRQRAAAGPPTGDAEDDRRQAPQ